MKVVPAIDVLGSKVYVVATGCGKNLSVYGRYAYRDIARRVCKELNDRYDAGYYVAKAV